MSRDAHQQAVAYSTELSDGGDTIRLPDAKHTRLKQLAARQGVSLNKLIKECSSVALAQFDAETRFRVRAARGNPAAGLALLEKLDLPLAPRSRSK